MKEVELLFKINESEVQNIREKLKDFFVKKVREVDTYFYPPDKDFLVSDEGRENLRVRENEDKKELTYKKVIYHNGIYSHSIENNINVSDAQTTIKVLKTVGFRKHLLIIKDREIFEDKNFHITIDNVKNLGLFVEIEWKGDETNEKEIRKLCMKKAQGLNLKTVQDKGYLRLLEEKMGKNKK